MKTNSAKEIVKKLDVFVKKAQVYVILGHHVCEWKTESKILNKILIK